MEDVRRDFADYLGEVLALDLMLGVMLAELEAAGELDDTLVILSGDHGIPGVPRGKTECYNLGIQAPLLMRWPGHIQPGRRVDDFVSLMDLGPTLLELAEADVPDSMTGRSFFEQIKSKPHQGLYVHPSRRSLRTHSR
ncbi:MAG: sulfatase-like hydrolase/transferase [Opitutae bacterium]|nr:sulfatase-like hydrolase/transferase [Opitutae bacterium]